MPLPCLLREENSGRNLAGESFPPRYCPIVLSAAEKRKPLIIGLGGLAEKRKLQLSSGNRVLPGKVVITNARSNSVPPNCRLLPLRETMIPTLAEAVLAVSPYIPAKLISGKNLRHMRAIASHLPGAIASFWGFECRLGEEAPLGDFLISVKADEGRVIVAGTHDSIELSESLKTNPVWNLGCKFSQHWADSTSPIYEKVDNMWLEFDVDGEPPAIPIPSLFFGCSPTQVENTGITLAKAEPSSHEWVTETALKILLGDSLSGEIVQKLRQCLGALPPEAYVFQIGLMLARKAETIRLCIRNISPQNIILYLEKIGWTGAIDLLQGTVSELASFTDRIDLDLDVGNAVLPKIGLECYIEGQPRSEPKWLAFLSYLVEGGLCYKPGPLINQRNRHNLTFSLPTSFDHTPTLNPPPPTSPLTASPWELDPIQKLTMCKRAVTELRLSARKPTHLSRFDDNSVSSGLLSVAKHSTISVLSRFPAGRIVSVIKLIKLMHLAKNEHWLLANK